MHGANKDIDQELQEELLVVVSYTVVYPRAVMVHASDASSTDGAVMAERWLNRIAFAAVLIDNLLQVLQRWIIQDDVFLICRCLFANLGFSGGKRKILLALILRDATETSDHLLHGFETGTALRHFFLLPE